MTNRKFNRRSILKLSGGLISANLLPQAFAKTPSAFRKPGRPLNILMILTDQEFGIQCQPKGLLDLLPSHQRLLEKGLHVPGYNVHTPPCTTSRSNIYTGQHVQKTGYYTNASPLGNAELSTPTIGQMMRKAGYHTSYKGKWHLTLINELQPTNTYPIYPNTRDYLESFGFSDFGYKGDPVGMSWEGYAEDQFIAGDAARLIKDYRDHDAANGKPWFLAVNLINPHDIMFFDATGKQSSTRAMKNFSSPVLTEPGDPMYEQNLGLDLPRSFYADDLSTKPDAHRAVEAFDNMLLGTIPREDEVAWQRYTNYYYNCLRNVDRNIAQLLWALESSDQLDSTIVIYTSDHGERAGAHGMRHKAGTIYREDVNVPMIIVHPDLPGGRTTNSVMSAVDLAPTLLALTGKDSTWRAQNTPNLPGIDVSSLLTNPSGKTERDARGHLFNGASNLHWQMKPRDPKAPTKISYDLSKRRLHRGVFDGRYKFARYFAPAEHHTPKDWKTLTAHNDLELYDTLHDPEEIINLAWGDPSKHKDLLLALNAKTNALIETEIGEDLGKIYPAPSSQYTKLRID